MPITSDKTIHQTFVDTLRKGYLALDDSIQNEINSFIHSQQHENGGFIDRAGNPDLYYSLFGFWLIEATRNEEAKSKLKISVLKQEACKLTNTIDSLAILLIKSQVVANMKKQSLLSIIKMLFKNGKAIDFRYQFFLISLVMDACGKNKTLFYFFGKVFLSLYKPQNNMPCSILAAMVFAKNSLGLNADKMQKKLLSLSLKHSGFKAFHHLENADGLSTGVALFSLKNSGFDLRQLAPECLSFVEQNYCEGAFLSGDGDLTKDLEYTFYGLLALGCLVKN